MNNLFSRHADARIEVSALMSTYWRESASNLDESLASLNQQTLQPDEIVLVVDGKIDDAQERVIAKYEASSVKLIVVREKDQRGLAHALNSGLSRCRGRYVMRMDSDDICEPERLQIQMAYLESHPEIDLCGAWVREFSDEDIVLGIKSSPCHHDEIAKALRFRNVISHPSVIIKREKLNAINGYRAEFGMLEDYDLFVRLVQAGAKMHVIPKVLLRFRTNLAQRARRGGLYYLAREFAFRRFCLATGFLSRQEFILTTALYSAFRLAGPLRRGLYSLART